MFDARLLLCAVGGGAVILLAPSHAFAATTDLVAFPAIAQTLIILLGVCLLAAASLRWGARRFTSAADSSLRVLARLPVEPRRALLVVKVGQRTLLLASSEAGLHPLGDVPPEDVELFERTSEPTSFRPLSDVSRETSEVTP